MPPRAARVLMLERIAEHVARSPVAFTRLERVVYPAHGARGPLLKAHVLDYYVRVAGALLPHVVNRPLALRRYPHGVTRESFFSKDWTGHDLPPVVRPVPVWSESREAPILYATVDSPEGLGWLVQAGAVEVHPWTARAGEDPGACATDVGLRSRACGLDRPDLLYVDLDPYVGPAREDAGGDPGVNADDWARGVEAALEVRDALRSLRLPSLVKTSGKRGLHVVVPVEPEHPFDAVRAVARAFGQHLAATRPDLITVARDPRERRGRVLFDYGQNTRGHTMAAPYSLRPTREATVSTPLEWDELEEADPAAFDVDSVPERLARGKDPWRGMDEARRPLRAMLSGAP